jgi:hypothetical protein
VPTPGVLPFGLQPFNETFAIGEMRRLRHFKRVQDFPRHDCRSRLAAAVALELVDDLTLTQNVTFALNDVAFGLAKTVEKHYPVHNNRGVRVG